MASDTSMTPFDIKYSDYILNGINIIIHKSIEFTYQSYESVNHSYFWPRSFGNNGNNIIINETIFDNIILNEAMFDDIIPNKPKFDNIILNETIFNNVNTKHMFPRETYSKNNNDNYLEKKKYLDITTNFINNETVFNNESSIILFQYYVINMFRKAIYDYVAINDCLGDDDIIFLYKGGNVMKMVYEKTLDLFKDNELLKNYINDRYNKCFEQGDSDFEILINPKLKNYEKVYSDINNITRYTLVKIREFLMKSENSIINFNSINEDKLKKLCENISENAKTFDKSNSLSNYSDIIGVIYWNGKQTTEYILPNQKEKYGRLDPKKRYVVNPDMYLSIDNKNSNLDHAADTTVTYDLSNRHAIQYTFNESLDFDNTRFALHRLKLDYGFYYYNLYGSIKMVSFPSELIDVSIPKKSDRKLCKIFENGIINSIDLYNYTRIVDVSDNELEKLFSPSYQSHEYPIKGKIQINTLFDGYNINGIVSDLIQAIFTYRDFPWKKPKYGKRLNRALYFIILQLNDGKYLNLTIDKDASLIKNNLLCILNKINGVFKNIIDCKEYRKISDVLNNTIYTLNNCIKDIKDMYCNKINAEPIIKNCIGLIILIADIIDLCYKIKSNGINKNDFEEFINFIDIIYFRINDLILYVEGKDDFRVLSNDIQKTTLDKLYKYKYLKYKNKYLMNANNTA